MRVRRARRITAVAIALSVLPFALSCGDNSSNNNNNGGPTGPNGQTNALVGTWNATSFMAMSTDFIAAGLSMSFTFASDGTYSFTVSGDTLGVFCTGTTSCTNLGTWDTSGGTLTLDRGTSDETSVSYSISGSTLSVSGTIESTPFTATFQKVS